jgi:hypothetical protein
LDLVQVDEEAIPQSILRIDGAIAQLKGHKKSDLAFEILNLAADFQSKASNNRLGQPRAQNTSLQKTVISRYKNPAPGVSKGKMLLAEMKAAKEDSGSGWIRLLLASTCSRGRKMVQK